MASIQRIPLPKSTALIRAVVFNVLAIGCLALISPTTGVAQSVYRGFPSLVWPKLYDIRYEKKKDERGEYDQPIFGKGALALKGKVVSLPGYMVPFENGTKSAHFMLSALPISACYFCGGAGPESVVEVFMKAPMAYTDKPVEFRGTLVLNGSNPDQMIYVIVQAEYVGEVEE